MTLWSEIKTNKQKLRLVNKFKSLMEHLQAGQLQGL